MDWTNLIAPLAALLGVFLGQQLQRRREILVRAQQSREEMLLDLAEWTMNQLYLVPQPSVLRDAEGNLKNVSWPTNAQAADRGQIPEEAEQRLLMRVKLYGSFNLFELARRASGLSDQAGGTVRSRRTDISGPSVFYLTYIALKDLWSQLEKEIGAQRRIPLLSKLGHRKERSGDQRKIDAEQEWLTIMADKRWWNSHDYWDEPTEVET